MGPIHLLIVLSLLSAYCTNAQAAPSVGPDGPISIDSSPADLSAFEASLISSQLAAGGYFAQSVSLTSLGPLPTASSPADLSAFEAALIKSQLSAEGYFSHPVTPSPLPAGPNSPLRTPSPSPATGLSPQDTPTPAAGGGGSNGGGDGSVGGVGLDGLPVPGSGSGGEDSDPNQKSPSPPPSPTSTPATITSMRSTPSASCTNSACNGCYTEDPSLSVSIDPIDDDDEGLDMRRKALAGRFYIEKRSQDAKTTGAVGSKSCSVRPYTLKPAYPGAADIVNNEKSPLPNMGAKFTSTASYWGITTAPSDNCRAPVWTLLDTAAATANGWALGGKSGQYCDVDHVYEVSTLDGFFTSQLGMGITCGDISNIFDADDSNNALDDGESQHGSRLTSIFGQLASFNNPDFLGMSGVLNEKKGSLWSDNLKALPPGVGGKGPDAKLNLMFEIAMVMTMQNDPRVNKLWVDTNTRIYQAFHAVDQLLEMENSRGTPITSASKPGTPIASNWASQYSNYIESKIARQNTLIQAKLTSLSNAASAATALPDFNSRYANIGSLQFTYALNFPTDLGQVNFAQPGPASTTSPPRVSSSPAPRPAGTPPPNVLASYTDASGFIEYITAGQEIFSYNGLTSNAPGPADQGSATPLPPGSLVSSANSAAAQANAAFPHVTVTPASGLPPQTSQNGKEAVFSAP